MEIIKRDGARQEWDTEKVKSAMMRAFAATGAEHPPHDIDHLVREVDHAVWNGRSAIEPPTVEEVQDIVERVLMDAHHHRVARAYVLYRDKRARLRVVPDPEAVSQFTHVMKYAGHVPREARRETFAETATRVEDMHQEFYRHDEIEDEIHEAFDHVRAKRVLPSMRSMQFGGEPILRNHGRMYNCAFTHVDRLRVFGEIFYVLLCGCGVGYSVQWHHVARLAEVKRVDRKRVSHFEIPDTIEGWADAVNHLLRCYTLTGEYPEFAYGSVRPHGSRISTGGRAPGHLPLKGALEAFRSILEGAAYRRLRPVECHDAICHLAEAVRAGGVRRSSLICLFSPDDSEMLFAKAHGNFVPHGVKDEDGNPVPPRNTHRRMANNSAVLLRGATKREVFDRVIETSRQWGCPGFYWTWSTEYGPNPCGEIGMDPRLLPEDHQPDTSADPDTTLQFDWRAYAAVGRVQHAVNCYGSRTGFQFCNLVEVNVAGCGDADQFVEACEAAARIGTLQAGYTKFPYLGPVTERVVRREALLGVGLTGVVDRPGVGLDPETLRRGSAEVYVENRRVAKAIGINPGARLTTVKPSGTASLELGCVGSGVHPHHAQRYFRRINASPTETPAVLFAKTNPHMVERKPDGDWAIVFPVKAPDGAVTLDDVSAIGQMDNVFTLYENWVAPGTARCCRGAVYPATGEVIPLQEGAPLERDTTVPDLTHNVSCTVSVGDDEWEEVIEYAWVNQNRITAMTFFSRFNDKAFPHAPREAVRTEDDLERWASLAANYKPVDWSALGEAEDGTDPMAVNACEGGACEVPQ